MTRKEMKGDRKKYYILGAKYFVFIFSIVLFLSLVQSAQPLPHAFEGKIIAKDNSITNMRTLTAVIDGVVTASAKIEGDSYSITVIDNTGLGGDIEFFVGEEKAKEEFIFSKFEITKTDLTFDTIPDETIGSCGDGICAVEECSFCAIDCERKCLGNGQCETAIGEDQVTAPLDCKVESESQTPESGSSGGSSGGGGGSSSTSTQSNEIPGVITLSSEVTNEPTGLVSINTLNEEEKQKESLEIQKKGKIFSLTGFSVFTNEEGKTRSGVTLIGLLLIGALIFLARKKMNKIKNE